jgi:hypothetical protein
MTWFRIDDKFGEHPKVRRLAKDRVAAVGLWTLCGIWCADNAAVNTMDGFVPVEVVRRHDPRLRLAMRLVEVGLWHESTSQDEVGFEFHQWSEHQPTRAEVELRRKKTAAKVAAWRAKKAGREADVATDDPTEEQTCNPVTTEVTNQVSNPAPDPTRPVKEEEQQTPSLRSGGARKRATPAKKASTRIPDDFAPTAEMIAWARENTPNVGRVETDDFIDYWRARSGRDAEKVDWPATWRRWMRKSQRDTEQHGPQRTVNGTTAPTGREAKARGWLELGLADPNADTNQPTFGASPELRALEGGRSA